MMKKKTILLGFILTMAIRATLTASSLDRYLEQLLETRIMPGFSVVVVRGDRVIFEKAYGKEYVDGVRPMTVNTSNAVGSLTKSFTAMAIMQLVEEGRMGLDDPVTDYLPWFRTANRELSDLITVRMLLDNTSGLRAPRVRSPGGPNRAMENLVKSLASVYLVREPGTSYEYSNEGFSVAGLLIEKVSGMSYNQYLAEHIFKPLRMTRTTNDPGDFDRLDVLYGHYHGTDHAIPVHREDEMLQEYSPAGSLLRASAKDLGNYLLALLNEGQYGDRRVISPESIQTMWTPYSSFPGLSVDDGGEGLPLHYGLGWFSGEMDGKTYIFHGGNRRNMSSMTFIAPGQNIGAVLLANIDMTLVDRYRYPNLVSILNNIIRLSLGEPLSDFAVPVIADPTLNSFGLSPKDRQKYTGDYRLTEGRDWVYLGSHLSITGGEHGLEAAIRKGEQVIERFALDFVTPKTAVSRNTAMPRTLQFGFLSGGKVSELYINGLKYSKITEAYRKRYTTRYPEDKHFMFDLPANWKISWQKSGFTGTGDTEAGETIVGKVFGPELAPESYFRELFPGNRVVHTGQIFTEIQGQYLWTEMAIESSGNGIVYRHMLLATGKGQKHFVIVLTTRENLTRTTARVMPSLLGTFSWEQ